MSGFSRNRMTWLLLLLSLPFGLLLSLRHLLGGDLFLGFLKSQMSLVGYVIGFFVAVRLFAALFSEESRRLVREQPGAHLVASLIAISLIWYDTSSSGGGTRGRHTRAHKEYAAEFKAGDTNAPLLAMDWFGESGVHFCRVNQSGLAFSARDVGHAIQGGHRSSLKSLGDGRDGFSLAEALNKLPPSVRKPLSKERQILVSGVRSNQWFDRVYDRADVPPEVEKLYQLTGAYLEWLIPVVQGHHMAYSEHANGYHTAFVAAAEAPTAVSAGFNGVFIWNLKKGTARDVATFKNMPSFYGNTVVAAISPDGNVVVLADIYGGVYGLDVKSEKFLWKAPPLDHDRVYHPTLAIGGSRYIYTAGMHIIERKDLMNGDQTVILTNNPGGVSTLAASKDGRILLAGMGGNSFAVWDAGSDKPVYEFVEPEDAHASISPDGKTILLTEFGQKILVILDWRKGKREHIPLRVPAFWACSMDWSPDGKRMAAYVDTYPPSIYVYDTVKWKPLAQWNCGQIGSDSKFAFSNDGLLLQFHDGDINALDLAALKGLSD
jgi:hypothetical protein